MNLRDCEMICGSDRRKIQVLSHKSVFILLFSLIFSFLLNDKFRGKNVFLLTHLKHDKGLDLHTAFFAKRSQAKPLNL